MIIVSFGFLIPHYQLLERHYLYMGRCFVLMGTLITNRCIHEIIAYYYKDNTLLSECIYNRILVYRQHTELRFIHFPALL